MAKFLQNGQISSSDLLNALQSLSRRCAIEKQESGWGRVYEIVRFRQLLLVNPPLQIFDRG
ncbi:hypothetical protein [Microcoleus sp. B13-B6]|uniref:hypothetical protein n=1 Tax=Microcoleus sp. B13-B6 TaxID=2818652 RepID=UPI002FD114CD